MNERYEYEGLPLDKPIIRDIFTNKQPPPQELLSISDLEERVRRFHLRHGGESPKIVNCYAAVRAVLEELRKAGRVEKVRESNGRVFFRSPNNSDLIDGVIISPYAKSWVTKTAQSVVVKYGFNFEVSPSTLLDTPT